MYDGSNIKVRYFPEEKLTELLDGGHIDLAVTAVNNSHLSAQLRPHYNFLRLNTTENFMLYSPALGQFPSVSALLPQLDCILSVSDQMAMGVTYEFLRKSKAPLRVEPCDNWSEVVIKVKNG